MKDKQKVFRILLLIFVLLSLAVQIFAQQRVLDTFENTDGWKIFASEGVDIKISSVEGIKGKGIRLDYNFTKGSGYGGIQKEIQVIYPENYQFSFYLKAISPNNNFEFKLADASGENVWWYNNRNYEFPRQWNKYTIKKRKIEFAWGPIEDKTLRRTEKLEFIIASYNGGQGTIFIDELTFLELPSSSGQLSDFKIIASSSADGAGPENMRDGNSETFWTSNKREKQEILLDLGGRKEFGAVKILWDNKNYAKKFSLLVSDDGKNFEKVYSAVKINSGTSYIRLLECEASFIKIDLEKSAGGKGYSIKEIELKDGEYSADINRFFINIAKDYPRGFYPRYFYEEKSYWTVVGVNNDIKEGLMNEDGMVEVDKSSFSIEPFLFYDGKLRTWNDAQSIQSLEKNFLPVPAVKWLGDIQLTTKAFAAGQANKSSVLFLSYTLKNISRETKKGNLYLAIRPFQVNPYYQWLNITGGASKIKSIDHSASSILVNGEKKIIPVSAANGFGAVDFDNGDIVNYLAKDELPGKKNVRDNSGFASAAIRFVFSLKPLEEKAFYIAVPFYKETPKDLRKGNIDFVSKELAATLDFWEEKISHIKFNLPHSADKLVNVLRSNLAYILINRDNAGIQPGSRSYERSWIRDGALTSSALLKNGIVKEVHDFIEWYAAHQFENGKVPCVVDRRGPDPVPENDSHGEFIYLIKTYFDYTKDTTFLRARYENVKKAAGYLEYLIAQRSTDYYKNSDDSIRAYYGILPESISHEGYSAKPMHSYWDSFWGLKGLKDAATIALIAGEKNDAAKFAALRDRFEKNLYNSIRLATATHKIDFIPGCVELGDFDATSTTIALYPCGELKNLPQDKLKNTFDRYFKFANDRAVGTIDWEAYTPYEVRTIGSFIFMNQIERAHFLIDYFLKDQRPQGWNHWAEVVWQNRRLPRFIGDMPHTWVGSDFLNSIRMMFVYEDDSDSSLVLGAGLYQDWIDHPDGISIEYLPTIYGDVSYFIRKDENKYNISFVLHSSENVKVAFKNFNGGKLPKKVLLNGEEITSFSANSISFITGKYPAALEVYY